jgi:probable HAF family extracellular repeat protein
MWVGRTDTSTSRSRTSTALLAALATVVGIAFALFTSLTLGTNSADAIASPTYGVTDLGTLGGQYSAAYGINDSGQVVGSSETSDWAVIQPFLYENGQMQDLNSLIPQDSGWSLNFAEAINTAGQIVGEGEINGQNHAFLYENGQMQDLDTLGSQYSAAYGINDKGQVVGSLYTSAGDPHAFLYENGQMQDLDTLGRYYFAYDINDSGQVVGYSANSDWVPQPFLYENGQMQDLNSLIPQDSGWSLQYAYGINKSGQIVGEGLVNGQTHAFLLTPPEAPQLNLPADITREATGPEGAVVNFTATATDNKDGTFAADCSPAPGSVFELGTTTVNCSATDTDGNTTPGSFNVTVKDTTLPTITGVPADQSVQATSSS